MADPISCDALSDPYRAHGGGDVPNETSNALCGHLLGDNMPEDEEEGFLALYIRRYHSPHNNYRLRILKGPPTVEGATSDVDPLVKRIACFQV